MRLATAQVVASYTMARLHVTARISPPLMNLTGTIEMLFCRHTGLNKFLTAF
jgi:hypothetical protein